jgi:predicted acylesterase/phospholipase RssA
MESPTRSLRAAARGATDFGKSKRRQIALGLQGGGAHGAFTWGVLDRLLQEPTLEIVGISGTSAGAMNAAITADGLRRGGPDQARIALRNYWTEVGRIPGLPVSSARKRWEEPGSGTSTTPRSSFGSIC